MKTVKMIVFATNITDDIFSMRLRAEKVARFGVSQKVIEAYDLYNDCTVQIAIRVVNWKTSELLPLEDVPFFSLRIAIEKLGYEVEKIS